LADAIDALKISIWSNDGTEARVVLAEAYEKAAMPTEALTELQTVLTRDPSHADAKQRLERLSGR
jgi:thioredoxin-like negative regulator of GroEL